MYLSLFFTLLYVDIIKAKDPGKHKMYEKKYILGCHMDSRDVYFIYFASQNQIYNGKNHNIPNKKTLNEIQSLQFNFLLEAGYLRYNDIFNRLRTEFV